VEPLKDYYRALLDRYGPQHWWPGETPFEIMVGAILTQNTSWKNVEKAIGTLRTYGLLDPGKIHETDQDTLALAIKPAGYFNLKAKRLKSFVEWFVSKHDADVERLKRIPPERLREELLEVKGIGPETADSILLYALDVPTAVVDAYTYRVLTRHGLIGEEAGYQDMKELLEQKLPRDRALYNEFHALLVAVGKEFCRATARCELCPLKRFLPGK
jgi:endonuclease-3 related protein